MTTSQLVAGMLAGVAALASLVAALAGLSELSRTGRLRNRTRRTVELWEKMPAGTGRDALERVINADAHQMERAAGRQGRRLRRVFDRPATLVLLAGLACIVAAIVDTWSTSMGANSNQAFADLTVRERVQTVAALSGLAVMYVWFLLFVAGPFGGRWIDRVYLRREIVKRARRIRRAQPS